MKIKTSQLLLSFLLILFMTTLSSRIFAQDQPDEYAYVSVTGKLFSKKLKVVVDFGDTPEQLKASENYSELLTNKKSYAAILNYMVEKEFELVETLDYTYFYNGSGGTSGIVFIMKKKKQ